MERYPALKYVPAALAPWKQEVLKQRQADINMYMELLNEAREKMARNSLPDCFAKHLVEEQANNGMTDLELAYAAGSPFGAGVETVCHSHILSTYDTES